MDIYILQRIKNREIEHSDFVSDLNVYCNFQLLIRRVHSRTTFNHRTLQTHGHTWRMTKRTCGNEIIYTAGSPQFAQTRETTAVLPRRRYYSRKTEGKTLESRN